LGRKMASSYWNRKQPPLISRRHVLTATMAGLGAAAFLAACGGSSNSSGSKASAVVEPVDTTKTARRGGIYKSVHTADFPSLDPCASPAALRNSTSWPSSRLMGVKAGYKEDPNGEIIGDLAESWSYSPDNLQLTIKLRADAKFAPLAPVNSRAM